jgi:hypothetical protein
LARIVPSDISKLALSGVHTSEVDTLQILKSGLPNDFTVFHGVHWAHEYKAWSHFGEIDFVVLNRSGELLFIEQKDGALVESADGLIKHYTDGDKDVGQQIHRSIDKMREKFKWQHGKKYKLALDYLIYCPDYKVTKVNAAGLNMDRVVDSIAKDGLCKRIESVLGLGVDTRDGLYETVEGFFYQTFDLVPDIHAHIGAQDRQFVRQSGSLASILTSLEMTPYRLKIDGSAGCGKSLFARRFLERAASQGRKVLLVCYNRPLADLLKDSVGEAGTVNTFYGFCDDFLQTRGQRLDFSTMRTDPGFWGKVQEQVMGEELDDECKYDTLIVDEGQDYESDWFEILRLFLRDDADILWLEDPDQNLQSRVPVHLDGFVGFRSRVNYRSPESISRFILDTLPISFEQGNDLPGLGVIVHEFEDVSDQQKIVGKIVQRLMRQGFLVQDIVVLTCRGVQSSIFSDLDEVGGIGLQKFTGEYDSTGKQLMTEGALLFDSVYRFKGKESAAVILVDIDPKSEHLEQAERLLYCGLTRATLRVELLVNKSNDYNARFLNSSCQVT